MPTKRKPRPTPLRPAAPDSPRAILADRISRLASKWLDLYEATLDDATRARTTLPAPPAAKAPDVASIKEVATVLTLCIQLDELAAATGGHIDEAQSRSDLKAVERALSEATL